MVLSGDDRGREIWAEKTEKDRGRPCQFVGIEGFERVRLRDDDKDEEEDGRWRMKMMISRKISFSRQPCSWGRRTIIFN